MKMAPLSPLPDSSCHNNRAYILVFIGNLHLNGDVIRIKKLRRQGTEPSHPLGSQNPTPTPHLTLSSVCPHS